MWGSIFVALSAAKIVVLGHQARRGGRLAPYSRFSCIKARTRLFARLRGGSEDEDGIVEDAISRLRRQIERTIETLTDDELDAPRGGLLYEIDKVFYHTRRAWRSSRPFVKALVGLALAVHGSDLPTTMLFSQTMKEVGVPQLQEALEKLEKRWQLASEAAKQEAPTLRKMKDRLILLEEEARDVKQALVAVKQEYANGDLDENAFEEARGRLQSELADLAFAAYRCRAGASSVRRIIDALDPHAVGSLASSAWNSIIACVATATSEKAAKVSVGLGIGADLDDGVLKTVVVPTLEKVRSSPLPPVLRNWTETTVKSLTQGTFVFTAFKTQRRATAALAGAVLGSRLFVDGLRQGTNSSRVFNKILRKDSPFVAIITTTLTVVSLTQTTRKIPFLAKPNFPQPLRIVLSPYFVAERLLTNLAPKAK